MDLDATKQRKHRPRPKGKSTLTLEQQQRFKDGVCLHYSKKGHFAKDCYAKQNQEKAKQASVMRKQLPLEGST